MEFEASPFNAVFGQNVPESDYFDYLRRMPRCWISSAAARFSRVTLLLPGRDTLPDDQEAMLSAAGWKNRQDIKTAGGLNEGEKFPPVFGRAENVFVNRENKKEELVMNKSCTGYISLVCALFGLSFSMAASAADAPKAAESCIACHGKDGNNTDANVPSIASYSEEYLARSLTRYQKKERPCVETEYLSGAKKGTKTDMCKVASELSENDIAQIGAFFVAQTFVRTAQTTDPELVKKGKSVYKLKCYTCHSEDGSFPGDHAGILAGQKMAYIRQQIKFFKEGKRPVPKKMLPKLEALDANEIEGVINYFGSLQ